MLSDTEKAYCRAMAALKNKDYSEAVENFEKAAESYGTNSEFNLLYQSTRLLVEVKRELSTTAAIDCQDKELIING